jgi:uncharacterized RDD family membrane protein YckC
VHPAKRFNRPNRPGNQRYYRVTGINNSHDADILAFIDQALRFLPAVIRIGIIDVLHCDWQCSKKSNVTFKGGRVHMKPIFMRLIFLLLVIAVISPMRVASAGFEHILDISLNEFDIKRNIELRHNEQTNDIAAVFGQVRINGTVKYDVCMLGGRLDLGSNAVINGDVLTIGTSINIQSNAFIKGDLIKLGGTLDAPRNFKAGGEQITVNRPVSIRKFLPSSTLLAYKSSRAWIFKATLFVLMVLLSMLFPGSLQACTDTVHDKPLYSLFLGLLVFLLLGPVCLLLIITVIGIFLVPFVFFVLLIALVFGITAVYRHIGHEAGRLTGIQILEKPLVALLIGTILFCILFAIPVLSWIALGLMLLLGLGAASLAFVGHMKRENPPPVPKAPAMTADNSTQNNQPPQPPSMTDLLTLPRAGFWIRTGAGLIDLILLSLAGSALFSIAPMTILLIYVIGMWTWKGATIGSMIFGFKVIRTNGQPVTFGVALVRGLMCILSLCIFGLGFFWIGWDREKQSWHDKVAGTYVVRVPKGVSLA